MSEEAAIYAFPKRQRWESKKYRDAAKDQPCTLRLSCCNRDKKTTALAHRPGAGMGIKADDFDAVDACSAFQTRSTGCRAGCHARLACPVGAAHRYGFEQLRHHTAAAVRSWRRSIEDGVPAPPPEWRRR